ncbi:MAG: 1-deoxy-D-xylulose-5-phosphate synthase, partial [Planctomycetales bacterium]|nr:1-deoxy-D-xylulose-5-phosphate synthase [Planctomycetales bacterium]
IEGERQPVELGKSEVFHWGHDGMIVACGTLLRECLQAAQTLREEGLDVGVVNVRFIKPLDAEVMRRVLAESQFVVTVEEGQLMTGFGSALLEFANDEGLSATHVRRLGLPDRFVEHGERGELLAELKLDAAGIVRTCRELADGEVTVGSHSTSAAK